MSARAVPIPAAESPFFRMKGTFSYVGISPYVPEGIITISYDRHDSANRNLPVSSTHMVRLPQGHPYPVIGQECRVAVRMGQRACVIYNDQKYVLWLDYRVPVLVHSAITKRATVGLVGQAENGVRTVSVIYKIRNEETNELDRYSVAFNIRTTGYPKPETGELCHIWICDNRIVALVQKVDRVERIYVVLGNVRFR